MDNVRKMDGTDSTVDKILDKMQDKKQDNMLDKNLDNIRMIRRKIRQCQVILCPRI